MDIKEKFKKGDYIINRTCGDIAVYQKMDDRGYMHFSYYYGNMFHHLKDVKAYTLQIHYQKMFDLCNDEEKQRMVDIINVAKELSEHEIQ